MELHGKRLDQVTLVEDSGEILPSHPRVVVLPVELEGGHALLSGGIVFSLDGHGGLPAQVAKWAGPSVAVPLRVYATCVARQDKDAKRRINKATRPKSV
ncbi:hypothetical protein [Spirillospora sp. NBC_01491]|uniref:hypothetical protein n=1 Tax=Spirillospora sp. NBC_01491 TaxID=2976007 RepID=UPI002E3332C4|nr:hypothetical protein [Spirillospora sp. NBC_01491]